MTGSDRIRFQPQDFNFALAGQRGAFSQAHMDASGQGTIVQLKSGRKLWILEDGQESLGILLNAGDI